MLNFKLKDVFLAVAWVGVPMVGYFSIGEAGFALGILAVGIMTFFAKNFGKNDKKKSPDTAKKNMH